MSSMQRYIPALLIAATAAVGFYVFQPAETAEAQQAKPDPKIITYTLPQDVKWEKGKERDHATLPSDPGATVELIRWHPGNMSRPHMHDTTRYIQVLEGTWWMGWGPEFDPDSTFPAPAGTSVVHHAGQLHYDGAKDEDALLLIISVENK